MNLSECVHVEENLLNLKTTSSLLKYLNTVKFNKAQIIKDGNPVPVVDTYTRNVGSYHVSPTKEKMTDVFWFRYIQNEVTKVIQKKYMKKFPALDLVQWEHIEFLKYEKDHKFHYHCDHGFQTPRTLSIVYLLNNDYEGGDLLFNFGTKQSMTIKKIPNSLIIFPSHFTFAHEVTPVTSGTRFSAVSWIL
jgi:predicted 2-oxoglutarate/Fe(II)-dependent dioxygenase YbiX